VSADSAADGNYHVLQSISVFGYRQTMVRRRVRNDENESLDSKSLESFKASLGPIAAHYSDAQLVQLRSDMRAAARLLLDLYLLKKQDPGKATRQGFDNPKTET
jgi:hypothetical protein